jgi:hypothetical protein
MRWWFLRAIEVHCAFNMEWFVWRGAERARNLCRICSETRLFHARKCVCSTPLFVCRNRVMCGVVGFVGFVLGSLAPLPSHPSSRCFVCLVGGQRELIFSVSIAPSTFFDAPPPVCVVRACDLAVCGVCGLGLCEISFPHCAGLWCAGANPATKYCLFCVVFCGH